MPPPSKNPPPPVPSINPMFLNRADLVGSSSNSPSADLASSSSNPSSSRVSSPHSLESRVPLGPPSIRSPPPDANFVDSMNSLRVDEHSSVNHPMLPGGLSIPNGLRPSGSMQSFSNHSSPFGIPVRNTSLQVGPQNGPRPHISDPGEHRHAGGPPGPMVGSSHPHGQLHMQSPSAHNNPPPNIPVFGQPPQYPGPGLMQGGFASVSPGPPRSGLGPGPYGPPPGPQSSRPPSDTSIRHMGIRKASSTRSIASQIDPLNFAPPVPSISGGLGPSISRNSSFSALQTPQSHPLLPSANAKAPSSTEGSFDAPSPPGSPVQDTSPMTYPSVVSAQMKCKVFLQQQHAQWKSLGSGRLKLYHQEVTNVKQLVVEADDKNKSILVSTIVLTDGVERVGKTGVAIELSDQGARSGVIYMIQLRNEKSAGGLYDSLLAGSDRSGFL